MNDQTETAAKEAAFEAWQDATCIVDLSDDEIQTMCGAEMDRINRNWKRGYRDIRDLV